MRTVMALAAGTRLGHYEILARLGAGGMGEVYRARDTRLKRDVAVKVLPDGWTGDAERIGRLQREAELLAALNHPGIASIYGFEEAGGLRGLVMELVEGPTLADLVACGPLPVEEACRIGAQIARALEAAHERGVIHRDLKPANIKLTPDRHVKVLDFGLAKIVQAPPVHADGPTRTGRTPHTAPGVVLGTPAYMSPEQAKGLAVDRRVDVWAFGCVLYELLTGHRAFGGDSFAEVMVSVLESDVDWSAVPGNTPTSIVALLRRCLERTPDERLRDIGEARVVLENPSVWLIEERPARVRRHLTVRVAVLAGIALGIASASALSVARGSWFQEPGQQRLMQFTMPLAPAERLPTTSSFRRPTDRSIAISRDGSFIVIAAEQETAYGPQVSLYRRAVDQPIATSIPGTEGAQTAFLSRDGAWIGFIGADRVLRRVRVNGGAPVDVGQLDLEPFGGRVIGASWEDDAAIVLGGVTGPLRRIPITGGAPAAVTSFVAGGSEYSHRLPEVLPQGYGILYTSMAHPVGDTGRIYVLPRVGGPSRLLLEDAADARYLSSGHLAFVRSGVLMVAPFDLQRLEISGVATPVVHDVMQSLGSDNPDWNSGAGQFDVSDNGTLVYASGGVYPPIVNRLLWLNRTGETAPIGEAGRSLLGPRISPDGNEIVVGQLRDSKQPLRTYDVARGIWTSWASVTGQVAFPVWTPDGQHVIFNWSAEGRMGVYMARRDGSSAPRQLTSGSRPRIPSDVSKDGQLLAFVETFTPTLSDIWVMPLNGSAPPQPVVRSQGEDLQPTFAPNGRWLAYSSDISGVLEVYVQAFPGPGPRIQVSSGGGTGATWAPGGQRLYFVKPSRTQATLMEVSIVTESTLRTSTPRALMPFPYLVSGPARSHDIAPGGERFIVTTYDQPDSLPVTQLSVVVNWRERLRTSAR